MDLYTRCPHCQTVFRLAAEQLDAAGGRVRCGACLRVFPARNSLVRPKTATATPTASPASSPARAASPATAAVPATPIPAAPPAPRANPAPIKPAAPPAPELDFDAFFAPPAAPTPGTEAIPRPAPAAPVAVPAAPTLTAPTAAPTPVGQPDAPDFSLLSAALTEIGSLNAPLAAPAAPVPAPSADTDTDTDTVDTRDRDDSFAITPADAADPITPITSEPTASDTDFGLIDSLPLDHDDVDDSVSHDKQAAPELDAIPVFSADSEPATPAPSTPSAKPAPALSNAMDDSERQDPHWRDDTPTSQETSAPDEAEAALALELPDDWASLKPKTRTEPVFDDDNGLLDGDLDALTANRNIVSPTGSRPRQASERDSLAWLRDEELPEEELPEDESPSSDSFDETPPHEAAPVDALRDAKVAAEAPANPIATAKPPSALAADELSEIEPPVVPAAAEKSAPAVATETASHTAANAGTTPTPGHHDEDVFEWHLDAVEAAAAEPQVFGDWQPDQSDTVKPAAEHDQLIPVRKASATSPAAAPTEVVAERAAGKPRTQAGDPDLGEISSDWEQPSTVIDAGMATPKRMARSAKREPEPFDQNAFTADPADRVYAPADTVDDSGDWTLTATEPHLDYESELYAQPKRRFPWRGLLGTVAALVLLSVLVTQLLWPQRAVLREDPQWGPWVEQLCSYIECNLPPRTDLGKIELQQRSVLKDRDDPRKLQIDLLIANKAAFAQPYPDINLRFTNIEGELVAERRFKPSEYLREQPDSAEMPVGVPVHIAFSVKAPDGNITGYEFNFLPPQ